VLFYLCGQLGWNYLQTNLATGGSIFTTNANLFGKVYFPRLVMPISVVLSNLVACVLQLASFLIIYLGFVLTHVPGTQALHLTRRRCCCRCCSCTRARCRWGVPLDVFADRKYRDLTQVMQLFVQLWMFASPVIYPLSNFPLKWRWVAELNPMTRSWNRSGFACWGSAR